MSLFDKIAVDLHNVANHYEQVRQLHMGAPHLVREDLMISYANVINFTCRPVILEAFELTGLLISPIALPILYANGLMDRNMIVEFVSGSWQCFKHSPVAIICALTLAANHSNAALATLVGAYLVKKIKD